jgi:hypothetical protein
MQRMIKKKWCLESRLDHLHRAHVADAARNDKVYTHVVDIAELRFVRYAGKLQLEVKSQRLPSILTFNGGEGRNRSIGRDRES